MTRNNNMINEGKLYTTIFISDDGIRFTPFKRAKFHINGKLLEQTKRH